jgi:hypothetical protein
MQCMSDENHRLALRPKPKYGVLEKRLSDMCIDRTEWIVKELSVSLAC